jgi:THO complex subunit 3
MKAPRDPVHIIQTFGENINIAWHPNGSLMAVGSKEDKVSLIDLTCAPVISKQLSNDVEVPFEFNC